APRGSFTSSMYDSSMRLGYLASLQLGPVGLFDRFKLPSVKPAQAQEMLRAGATLLDVRENSEWNAGHAPGAVHVPVSNVGAQAPKRLPKGRPVIVTCRSGSRSRGATRILREKGIEAYNLSGGMSAWESAGGRLIGKGNRPGTIA
ncbi:MAG TPA: rhodanese-like domain-containing protein, partial [Candidatus Nanopelagicales bacterium]|nr:rhodanese-like domain-containing protein [Candidatus Nanopelagicales bacterium]